MAQLIYEITGDISGLQSAINQASNLIRDVAAQSSQVKVADISPQIVAGVAALDQLDKKLLVITGNATLFGDSIKSQASQVSAYQGAINSLLANGFDPMDGDVQKLKGHIDDLTNSLRNIKNVEAEVATNSKETFAEVQAFLSETRNAQSQSTASPVNITPVGGLGQSSALTGLNQQLLAGTITAQQYNAALIEANLSQHLISESATGAAGALEAEIGIIQGLKEQLASLNAQRIVAPQEDLAALNAKIQQTELSLSQAANVGKVGFDQMGNAIKGVSVQNLNGQLFALSNNLFGARQISRDLVRTFDSTSVGTFARSIGLLAVDFLFFAQNAQFAKTSTIGATTAIAVEGEVAAGSALSTGALGAAFASLLTPTSLIVLGIAAAGAAFIAFEGAQKKAITATTQAAEDLKAFNAVQKDSAAEFGKQVASLQQLYDATQNVALSMEKRLEAAQRLRDIFPDEFQNATNLAIVNGQLKDSYIALTDSMLQNAVAQAAQKQIADQELIIARAQEQITKIKIANANELLKSKQDEKSGSFDVEGGGILAQDNLDKSNKRAAQSIKDQQAIAQQARNTIKNILEPLALDFNTATEKLANANKFLGANLEKFNSLIAKSTDKQQFENIKNALQTELDALAPGDSKIANLRAKIAQVDQIIKNAYTVKLTGKAPVDPFIAINNSLDEIANHINKIATQSGLTGYALKVQEIENTYKGINTQLDQQQAKLDRLNATNLDPKKQGEKDAAQTKIDTDRANAALAKKKDLSDAGITEAQRVASEIQRINDEFGVKAEVSRGRELAQIQKRYDAEVTKAKGKAEILSAIESGRIVAIQAVNDKYIQQEQQTYARITDIANQAFQLLATGEESRTDKINLESQKRITAANAEFNKLRDIAKSLPQSSTDQINTIQAQVNLVIKAANIQQVSEEISKNFASAMQSAVQGFVSNFYTSLTGLGQARQTIDDKYSQQLQQQQQAYASSVAAGDGKITAAQNQSTIDQINNLKRLEQQSTTSFGAIFSSLVSKFTQTFNESILNSFTKQLTENLGKTLLTPTAKQLTISPEQQAAQNVAATLKSAGTNLAAQIEKAGSAYATHVQSTGTDFNTQVQNAGTTFATAVENAGAAFAAKANGVPISPDLLSGASGGSQLLVAASPTAAEINGLSTSLNSSSAAFAGTIGAGAAAAAGSLIGGADEAAAKTTAAASKLSSSVAGWAAAASVAGGLVSGLGGPTNKVTSTLGGALSGAGEGALIGTALGGPIIGTAIGAVVGAIGGLISASKAKKQEELQQKQLEQQKLTNELIARQNALAYTTSIVGRMTNQGIITGVDINSFGQLTATVSGKDLQFVLGRVANGR